MEKQMRMKTLWLNVYYWKIQTNDQANGDETSLFSLVMHFILKAKK